MQCPRCKHENPSSQKFCGDCGAPLARPDQGGAPAASYADLQREVEHLARAVTEALEQQTATSEILRAISSSPTDVQPVFQTIAESAVRLSGALFGSVYRFDGELVHMVAQHNYPPAALEFSQRIFPSPPNRQIFTGRAILDRAVVHVPDVSQDPERLLIRDIAERVGFRSVLSVPMLREGSPIGAITLWHSAVAPFSDKHVALLQTFADQAVIAIENVRLFKELEVRNHDLTEALEQQTATGEVLRAISRAQTDAQPVFDIIAASALQLCGADYSQVQLYDGELLHLAALESVNPKGAEAIRRAYSLPVGAGTLGGRAIRTRAVVQIPDLLPDRAYEYQSTSEASGVRSLLSIPMLKDGEPIGVIAVGRPTPGAFADARIALLQTFADQAVIAIENVRLFKELQARTGELTQSVEKLTALGEVSHALSSTLDIETVLDTIVARASQLAGAAGCSIFEYDAAAEQFELRATHNYDAEFVEALRVTPLRKGEALMGRAAEMREPVQVPDITQPGAYQSSLRDTLIRFGYRALLAVPLVRADPI